MDKILVIDDNDSIRETLTNLLTRLNYSVLSASNGRMGIDIAKKEQPDLIISDLRMPQMDGLEVLEELQKYDPQIRVIIITAHDDMLTTVQAMQKGAYDFIEKPIEIERLKISIKRALQNKKLSEKIETIISDQTSSNRFESTLVGKSQIMREVYKKIGQVSANRVTVLIQGESGTGKELVAKSVHYGGITKDDPFVAVNCTAITETLLESELFGHEKGAFTGADKIKKGKFELAGEGTVFLDEISEMSPNLQVKLLRVLQEKEFERVGGESIIPMRARIITATNKDLTSLVKQGKFREDLYFRLKVVSLELPPLRDRKEDVPLLVTYFLNKINAELHKSVNKIPDEAMEYLKSYDWIGNVRELENTLMQAVVLTNGDVLLKENIMIRSSNRSLEDYHPGRMSLSEIEKRHIEYVLNDTKWNKSKAAEILGISLPTLYSKIENYHLERKV
ncbi:MAG: sigma-54 dependent transcriptional regulator [Bacteroidetes bacterium]|nr:sigma-54 dependent transcriptional regulator [Bacteroidota bacterium]